MSNVQDRQAALAQNFAERAERLGLPLSGDLHLDAKMLRDAESDARAQQDEIGNKRAGFKKQHGDLLLESGMAAASFVVSSNPNAAMGSLFNLVKTSFKQFMLLQQEAAFSDSLSPTTFDAKSLLSKFKSAASGEQSRSAPAILAEPSPAQPSPVRAATPQNVMV